MAIDAISAFRSTSPAGSARKASGSGFADVLQQTTIQPKTAAQELQEYVDMTPAQRMRLDLLKKLGLTEEDLANMSPAEREGAETKLRDLVQQQMQEAAARQETAQRAALESTRRIDTLA